MANRYSKPVFVLVLARGFVFSKDFSHYSVLRNIFPAKFHHFATKFHISLHPYSASGGKISFFCNFRLQNEKFSFSYIAATALGLSWEDRARSEDSGSYNNISVRPLSVEL